MYCNKFQELLEYLKLEHTPKQWRLFIDSPKISLKAVLLHDGNKCPSIPLAHAVHVLEAYDNLQVLMQKVHSEEHQWNITYVLTSRL
jgi:hypothetical protein